MYGAVCRFCYVTDISLTICLSQVMFRPYMNRPVNILHKHVANRPLILQNIKLLCCFKTIDIILL